MLATHPMTYPVSSFVASYLISATKHGISVDILVLPGEDYLKFFKSFLILGIPPSYHPEEEIPALGVNPHETIPVQPQLK